MRMPLVPTKRCLISMALEHTASSPRREMRSAPTSAMVRAHAERVAATPPSREEDTMSDHANDPKRPGSVDRRTFLKPAGAAGAAAVIASRLPAPRSEEHTSELQSHLNLVCRLLLEKKKKQVQ